MGLKLLITLFTGLPVLHGVNFPTITTIDVLWLEKNQSEFNIFVTGQKVSGIVELRIIDFYKGCKYVIPEGWRPLKRSKVLINQNGVLREIYLNPEGTIDTYGMANDGLVWFQAIYLLGS